GSCARSAGGTRPRRPSPPSRRRRAPGGCGSTTSDPASTPPTWPPRGPRDGRRADVGPRRTDGPAGPRAPRRLRARAARRPGLPRGPGRVDGLHGRCGIGRPRRHGGLRGARPPRPRRGGRRAVRPHRDRRHAHRRRRPGPRPAGRRRRGDPAQAAGARPRRVRGRRRRRPALPRGRRADMSTRAVLSIGGNQGDPLALLRGVAEAAASEGLLRAASSVYATPAWGGVAQDDFLNAVLVVVHPGTPRDVLEWGFARERDAGRTRDVRWGPRTLDVDVIAAEVDGAAVTDRDETLTLPHPRAAERAFVLVPWAEVEPDAHLHGRPLQAHLAELDAGEVAAVRRLEHALAPEPGEGRGCRASPSPPSRWSHSSPPSPPTSSSAPSWVRCPVSAGAGSRCSPWARSTWCSRSGSVRRSTTAGSGRTGARCTRSPSRAAGRSGRRPRS